MLKPSYCVRLVNMRLKISGYLVDKRRVLCVEFTTDAAIFPGRYMPQQSYCTVSYTHLAQYSGSADINSGRGAIVIGLAAVIIGEAIISKISKNFFIHLIGVVLGGVVYYIVYQAVSYTHLATRALP